MCARARTRARARAGTCVRGARVHLNRRQQASLSLRLADQTLNIFRYERHDALDLEATAKHGIHGCWDPSLHVAEALFQLNDKSALLAHDMGDDQISEKKNLK